MGGRNGCGRSRNIVTVVLAVRNRIGECRSLRADGVLFRFIAAVFVLVFGEEEKAERGRNERQGSSFESEVRGADQVQ